MIELIIRASPAVLFPIGLALVLWSNWRNRWNRRL